MNIFEKIKKSDNKLSYILSAIFVLFTGGINLYGYFNLPDEIATQFSLSGGNVNRMPTTVYLLIVFVAVLLISILYLKAENEKRIKWLITDIVIVIANTAMIVSQL